MEKKLSNEYLIGITLINPIVYLAYYLLMVIMTAIAQDTLHASLSRTGFVPGIHIIGTLLAHLFTGEQLELLGWKFTLRGGVIFYLLTTLACLHTPAIGALYLVRFLSGSGRGTASTATNAIVTTYIPAPKKGRDINYYGLSVSLAVAVGPFLGMILLNMTSSHFVIQFSITLTFFVTITCPVFPVRNISSSEEQKTSLRLWDINSFIEKKTLFTTGIAFLIGLSYSSILSFLSPYTKVIHLVAAGSFFFIVYALVITFTRPLTGRIFDIKEEQYVMYPSCLLSTAGLFLLSVTTNSMTLLVFRALVDLDYDTFMPDGQAVCLKIVKEHRINIALSTYFIGLDLGLGVGPHLMRVLKSLTSFRELYVIAGVIPLVCIAFYPVNGRKHSHEVEGGLIELLESEI